MQYKTFSEYLRSRISREWGAKAKLARLLRLNPATISRYLSGKFGPTIAQAQRIAEFFGDDPAEVVAITSKGVEVLGVVAPDELAEATAAYRASAPIPVIGRTSAGGDVLDYQWTDQGFPAGAGEDSVPIGDHGPHDYALRVDGDSMAPFIPPGSLLIVAPHKPLIPGRLAVVKSLSGDCWVKMVWPHSEHFVLHPVNPRYPTFQVKADEVLLIHPVIWIKMS